MQPILIKLPPKHYHSAGLVYRSGRRHITHWLSDAVEMASGSPWFVNLSAEMLFFFLFFFFSWPSLCCAFEQLPVVKMHPWPKALKVIRDEWKPFELFLLFHVTPLFSEASRRNGSSRFSCSCLKAISPSAALFSRPAVKEALCCSG